MSYNSSPFLLTKIFKIEGIARITFSQNLKNPFIL